MILASIYPCPFDTQVRHDFSSAIYKNGKIYAYEEDKANGYKNNSNYMFPELSLFYGFKELKITPSDVDIWLLPEPSKRFKKRELYVFFSHILKCYEGNEKNFLKWVNKKIVFIKHHDSHLGLAVASSGFKKTIYLSIDGGGDFGDERNSVYGEYSNNKFKNLANLNGLDNICSFHAFITDFLCYGIDNGKVGGLAAYGKIQKKLYDELDKLIEVKNNGIKFHRKRYLKSKYNINKFSFDGYQRYKVLNTQPSSTNILKKCKGYLVEDVAKTCEELIKDKLYDFLKIIKKRSNFENIVFSGGLFLNIGLNGFISEKKIFKKYFFNLAPHDSGLSLGAISYYLLNSNKKLYKLNKLGLNPYIGPSFSNEEVIKIIKKFNLSYEKISNYHYDVAKNISNKKIVGIFNGRAEFGQRSLGNRSILADPRSANSKKRLNLLLKKRDWFMPFAPAIPIEYFHKWFPNQHPSYYMQVTNTIKDRNIAKKIPSAVHVDLNLPIASSRTKYKQRFLANYSSI